MKASARHQYAMWLPGSSQVALYESELSRIKEIMNSVKMITDVKNCAITLKGLGRLYKWPKGDFVFCLSQVKANTLLLFNFSLFTGGRG